MEEKKGNEEDATANGEEDDELDELSKLEKTLPQEKIHVTSKSPVGDISVVTLIRTDTTLDHSQKAEKVCKECCCPGKH